MKKRLFSLILCLLLCAQMTISVGAVTGGYYRGDIDENGRVSAGDARLILRIAAKLESNVSERRRMIAEMDDDGRVTAADARLALRIAALLDSAIWISEYDEREDDPSSLSSWDVYELARLYTVAIYARSYEGWMLGTGVVLDSSGTVLTCEHVISGAIEIYVTDCFDNIYTNVHYTNSDATRDLAIIDIGSWDYETAVLNYEEPGIGDAVYALGHPEGQMYTFTSGNILRLNCDLSGMDPGYSVRAYASDVPMDHGNSGGPLINNRGEVIGINAWIAEAAEETPFGYGETFWVSLTVPISYLEYLYY